MSIIYIHIPICNCYCLQITYVDYRLLSFLYSSIFLKNLLHDLCTLSSNLMYERSVSVLLEHNKRTELHFSIMWDFLNGDIRLIW